MGSKKFWKKLADTAREKLMGALMTALILAVVGLTTFAIRAYNTVDKVVPAMQDTIKTLKDTVDNLDKSPIEIKEEMQEIKIQQREIKIEQINQKEDINEIKDYQKLILEKLIKMENGH